MEINPAPWRGEQYFLGFSKRKSNGDQDTDRPKSNFNGVKSRGKPRKDDDLKESTPLPRSEDDEDFVTPWVKDLLTFSNTVRDHIRRQDHK